jgi:hypothetical protein
MLKNLCWTYNPWKKNGNMHPTQIWMEFIGNIYHSNISTEYEYHTSLKILVAVIELEKQTWWQAKYANKTCFYLFESNDQ